MVGNATKWDLVPGGVTAPKGFQAAGVAAQIRKKGRRDLAVIYSQVPAVAAALYTQNRVKAAPVLVTREHLAGRTAQAIVVNSGIANACTGEQGLADARQMALWTGEMLGIAPEHVVVASTGVMGVPLPMQKIEAGIRRAVKELSVAGGGAAAEAIMTTDTTPKEYAVKFTCGGKEITVGGIAKGSGMIHPNLATMLAFIATDAAVSPDALYDALRWAGDRSFNAVTVDGDTSTNDMVVCLANGLAGNEPITGHGSDFLLFRDALFAVCRELAKMIARDGEGASKFLEVRVKGAACEEDGRTIARAVAGSSLVKAALFGEDANWGRILSAAGNAGVSFEPDKVDIYLGDLQVAARGTGLSFDEDRARSILEGREVIITLDLKQGDAEAVAWGCDLSFDYVRINAQYRT
ncbi:MAG TPA: bifunctional glutamate N-acetyltransferase/amino-acid acetyltransferase ArgJ [Syntrophomonadaceae bacterium]|nr:bifunctional glutamate N-acetyltransferase/amino-acid acetyltransferase ArgJ [Syntrophomonadaceae bacterium]